MRDKANALSFPERNIYKLVCAHCCYLKVRPDVGHVSCEREQQIKWMRTKGWERRQVERNDTSA